MATKQNNNDNDMAAADSAGTPVKTPGTTSKDTPAKAGTGTQTKSFAPTARDALFMFTVIMKNENALNVKWDEVAEEMGLKNASVAKVC